MSSVLKLTIPESSYDLSSYTLQPRSKSQLLLYLIRLTRGAAISLVITYLVGFFIVKPLLETTVSRRFELLECIRGNLRDFYLKAITKINYIPIVAIKRNDKLYADAITQTEPPSLGGFEEKEDTLFQTDLHKKLKKVSTLLQDSVRSYSVENLANCKSFSYSIKDLQNKADLIYFNEDEFFLLDETASLVRAAEATTTSNKRLRRRNLAVDTRNEIRSIKGLYMSGQV